MPKVKLIHSLTDLTSTQRHHLLMNLQLLSRHCKGIFPQPLLPFSLDLEESQFTITPHDGVMLFKFTGPNDSVLSFFVESWGEPLCLDDIHEIKGCLWDIQLFISILIVAWMDLLPSPFE